MPHHGRSVSQNLQQRPVLKPQEVMELGVGEFVGLTVAEENKRFCGQIGITSQEQCRELPNFVVGINSKNSDQWI